jgi:hypothetical protein
MIVLSHRGYWHTVPEKNTEVAFRRSFSLGFGTETDVRDCAGKLVISHDMPLADAMPFGEFLAMTDSAAKLPLALNIKSDGLAMALKEAMQNYDRSAWFVFDMSVPDMRAHLRAGNPVFTRMSEVENPPAWLAESEGVWLDNFEGEWFGLETITALLSQGKRVCIVSSELHGRDPMELWTMLLPVSGHGNLMLCTDFPERAEDFFKKVYQ